MTDNRRATLPLYNVIIAFCFMGQYSEKLDDKIGNDASTPLQVTVCSVSTS